MGKFVDFQQIKEEVPIERAISFLNLDMKESGSQFRGQCPVCGGNERGLVITPDKGVFYCFSAKKGGDVIALVAHIEEIGMKTAAEQLAERYCTVGTVQSRTVPQETRGKEGERTLQPLGYLESGHEAVTAVGFEQKDAEAIGIGYASKGLMRGYVAVPIRLPDGTLVGYIGVTEAKLPPRFHIDGSNVVPLTKKTA